MQRDHKFGLALGVLLVGFAAALCFPRQADTVRVPLRLEDSAQLDADIALLPVRAYTEAESTPAAKTPATASLAEPALPDHQGLAGSAAAPDPIFDSTITPPPASLSAGGDRSDSDAGMTAYTVRSGDTLSGLAAKFLGNSGRYLEIYEANRDALSSPDALRPAMVLMIPPKTVNAAPAARVSEASRSERPASSTNFASDAVPDPADAASRFRPAGRRLFVPHAAQKSR